MDTTDNRSEVVLAMRYERDISQHYYLVIAGDFVEGPTEVIARVFAIAGEPFFVSADDTSGRPQ
jgi:hypothetical protein